MAQLKSAAIFDLDGTLIPHTSAEKTFIFYLLRNGILSPLNLVQMLTAIWKTKGNLHAITRVNKAYLRNKEFQKLQDIARIYFEPRIHDFVFPQMQDKINQHRNRGDLLLLLTGTLDLIAACFVRKLQLHGYKATTLEVCMGKYTGNVCGIMPYGIGKLEVLRELKKEYTFAPDSSFLYANVYSDRFVMNAVEHPVAVNPDHKLRKYAKRFGWEILDVKNK
jgi:HAD superfamily hydrolase (TIGR01490 family)